MATGILSFSETWRMVEMTWPWTDLVPCERLSRKTSAPARMSPSITSGGAEDGPIVAIILVFLLGIVIQGIIPLFTDRSQQLKASLTKRAAAI